MNRRTFLQALSMGSLLPLGLANAFSLLKQGNLGAEDLRAAYLHSNQEGKPLLVLIGPDKPVDERHSDWGMPLLGEAESDAGDLFKFGGDAMWAALALCNVSVTHRPSLRAFLHSEGLDCHVSESAWSILIEPHGSNHPPHGPVVLFDSPIPKRETPAWDPEKQNQKEFMEGLAQRVAGRAAEWTATLVGTQETLALRANACVEAIGKSDAQLALDMACAPEKLIPDSQSPRTYSHSALRPLDPDLAAIDRGAAVVCMTLPDSEIKRNRLRDAARDRLWHRSPSGGTWATSMGCAATSFMGHEPRVSIGCGMGFSPEQSRRFLAFYQPLPVETKPDPEESR